MPLPLEYRCRAFVVIDMENQECFSSGTNKQRITEEKVHLRHEQAVQNMAEIGSTFGKLHHKHSGLTEGNIVLVQER